MGVGGYVMEVPRALPVGLHKVITNVWGEIEGYRPLKKSTRKEIEVNAKAHKVLKG
jgi:hypothetical protein